MKDEFDETLKRREFIEAYRTRKSNEAPRELMDQIGAPRRMLSSWLSDQTFRGELDQIDSERVWLAREVVYRKIGDIFTVMAELASQRGPNSLRAAEVIFRAISPTKEQKSKEEGTTEQQGSVSTDELVRRRDELLKILQDAEGDVGGDAQESDGTGSGDPEEDSD